MKNNIKIAITTILFILLFYNERIGLNLSFFTLFLILASAFNYRKHFFQSYNILYISVLSSISVSSFYYNSWYLILMNIIGIILLPYFILDKEKIFILSIPQSILNFSERLIYSFPSINQFFKQIQYNTLIKGFLLPSIAIGLFLLLYSTANEYFKSYFLFLIQKIDFTFLCLTLLGFIISIYFWGYQITRLLGKDNHFFKLNLDTKDYTNIEAAKFKNAFFSGNFLFTSLNLILILFLITEVIQINDLNEKIHSGSNIEVTILEIFHCVSSGVQVIILSIVFAISLIFIYFKNELNFFPKSNFLRRQALLWVLLNGFAIVTESIKVYQSIDYSGYTIKRFGMFGFLLLALMGLAYTLFKLIHKKTNYYVIGNMIWTVAIFTAIISPINWSAIVTNLNYNNIIRKQKPVEIWRLTEEIRYNHIQLIPYLSLPNLKIRDSVAISNRINEVQKLPKRNFIEQIGYESKVISYFKKNSNEK